VKLIKLYQISRKKEKKMNTVNVIEVTDTDSMSIDQLAAFPDTPEGNKQAEDLFIKLIEEKHPKEIAQISFAVEDGWFCCDNYYLAIVHSTN
jgi:hypothetical protein